MTDTQSPEAAALLEEVDKRRQLIRRRLGNGWFELAVLGGALVAVALAGLAGSRLGPLQGAACAVIFVVAYLVVAARYLRLRRQFGVSYEVFSGLLLSAVLFFGFALLSWLLDGTVEVLAYATIPAIVSAMIAVRTRQPVFHYLAGVILAGGIASAVTDSGWATSAVYGIGFLAIAVTLLGRINSDRTA